GKTFLLLFASFAVLWSILQIPLLPNVHVEGGTFRAPAFRAISQLGLFLFAITPILLAPLILRKPEELYRAGTIYVWSIFVLCVFGWIQVAVWYETGTNPFPIGYLNRLLGGMADEREGIYEFLDMALYRMNSFGGEPKEFGASVVIAMLFLQMR